jgi:hypothetical protein
MTYLAIAGGIVSFVCFVLLLCAWAVGQATEQQDAACGSALEKEYLKSMETKDEM